MSALQKIGNQSWVTVQRLLPGLALCGAIAAIGIALGRIDELRSHGFSALTLAIVIGMLIGNTVYARIAANGGAGVAFSRQRLLRLGVVLYGLRLTIQDIGHVGIAGVVIDALVLGSTFVLACWIGTRWLDLDRATAMLIGAGSSVCGAAAVMAAGPVVKARAEQVTVAVATVVVFGTLAIFLYPPLHSLNQHWRVIAGGSAGFGIYVGSTIHEVAQVVAAARSIDPDAADTAVIAKMVRVMMLGPCLLVLAGWLARQDAKQARGGRGLVVAGPLAQVDPSLVPRTGLPVPWFAFAFVGVVLFNSLNLLPAPALSVAVKVDTALLAMAMAGLGLATHIGAIRKAGLKPLLLAALLFAWLVVGGGLINHVVETWLV